MLEPMPFPTKLISVGCYGFPTHLVADCLHSKFGKANDLCVPPILPLEAPEYTQAVFADLRKILETSVPLQVPFSIHLNTETSVDDLLAAAKRSFAVCVNKCIFFKTASEQEAFETCKDLLYHILMLLRLKIKELKATFSLYSPSDLEQHNSSSNTHQKPLLLPSVILASFKSNTFSALDHARSVYDTVSKIYDEVAEKLRVIKSQITLASFNDQALCDLAGFVARYAYCVFLCYFVSFVYPFQPWQTCSQKIGRAHV